MVPFFGRIDRPTTFITNVLMCSTLYSIYFKFSVQVIMHDCCFVDPGHLRHVRGLDGHVNKDICCGFETGIGIGNVQKRNSGP